jgi:GNAT superfamily N-acetyltransferase
MDANQPLTQALRDGIVIGDKRGRGIRYRYVRPADDLEEITSMLHQAYAPLAAAGLRHIASHQDAARTRRRMERGETILALDGDVIVGTITLADADKTGGSPFYDRPDVASFGQFAVRPHYQGTGIGGTLMELVERRARERGVAVLGLDTSEPATDLIALYQRRGFSFIEHVQWSEVNYRSVVMGKKL